MRRFLLDTHALIWFFENDAKLPADVKILIENPENEVFVSIASFWEIAIKKGLAKLSIQKSVDEMFGECANQDIRVLAISRKEIVHVETLPYHHGDPFDRIIVATSFVQNLEIISVDSVFDDYLVKRVW